MRLEIDYPAIYIDGLFLCYVGVNDGATLRPGRYAVEATYSHSHRKNLVRVDGIGWIGGNKDCNVVLGRIRNRDDVIPCESFEKRILALVETAQDDGKTVELIVK